MHYSEPAPVASWPPAGGANHAEHVRCSWRFPPGVNTACGAVPVRGGVDAGSCVTSCGLGIFADQAAELVPPEHSAARYLVA